jgi:hypothetical protein
MELATQNQATTLFVVSTAKGWIIASENGMKVSGYYKTVEQAKDAVKNLVPEENVQIVLQAA